MENVPLPRRSPWRFSLRELLLLMLAIGAFLGWGRAIYQYYKPFRPTPVASTLDLTADIEAIRKSLGETDFSYWSAGGGGRSDGRSVEKDYHYAFPLSAIHTDAFAEQLKQRVQKQMETSGCSVWGAGDATVGNDFHQIQLDYRHDVTVGKLRMVLLRTNDKEAQILLFLEEHRESR